MAKSILTDKMHESVTYAPTLYISMFKFVYLAIKISLES